jgi:parvulin-like peptidyl-prolyl isomerase
MPPFRARNTEFGSLALSMQTNQISGVLTNEEGYRIFQLLEKIPAKKFAFAAVTNKIKNYIIAGKTADLAPAYIAQLRQAAGVEILDAGLKTEFAEAEARAAEEAKNPSGFQPTKAPPMGP